MNDTKKITGVLDKALPSIEKITQAITENSERISESCHILNPPSVLCSGVVNYAVHKDINVTRSEANVKDFIDKLNRHSSPSATCLYALRDFNCLLEFQKCSPEGKLIPVCSSIRTKAQECTTLSLDEKIIDLNKLGEKDCFGASLLLIPPLSKNISSLDSKLTNSSLSQASLEKTNSSSSLNSHKVPDASKINLIDCTRRSYLAKWNDTSCFSLKPSDVKKLPSTKLQELKYGKIEFELLESINCIDSLNLLKAEVEQVCSCDSNISEIYTPCESSGSSLSNFNGSKIISFREVEYVLGIEKDLNFSEIENPQNFQSSSIDSLIKDAFYYRTCDRLIGVPEVYTKKTCNSTIDSGLKILTDWKDAAISKKFRSGCTPLECLSHLKYMPPMLPSLNTTGISKNKILPFKQDICQVDIKECPLWNFNSEAISIGEYLPKIASYLELDVQAFSNSSQPAIIFSFRSLAQPLYEGLRFLLNGIPAMDIVYNQSSFKGYAVPLVPGKVHIARWEFVRGGSIGAASLNYADLQSIILRNAFIVDSNQTKLLQQSVHSKNSLVHVAPEAPVHNQTSEVILNDSNVAASLSVVTILFTLMTGIGVTCILLWFWTQHKKKYSNRKLPLESDVPRQDYSELGLQFSFKGKKSVGDYTPLTETLPPNIELDTFDISDSSMSLVENSEEF